MRSSLFASARCVAVATLLSLPGLAFGGECCGEYDFGQYEPAYAPNSNELAFVTSNAYPPWFEYWEALVANGYYFGRSANVKHPTWAPDENSIAFTHLDGIWITTRAVQNEGTPLTNGFWDTDPSWSPTGGRIAFIRNGNVWAMNEDGSSPIQITTLGGCSEPAISPDGARVAFGSGGNVWIQALLPGATPYVLTEGSRPAWSPSGLWIAFDSARSGNPDIWVIANGGPTAVRITTDPGSDTDPTWSGDGMTIAYARNTSTCICIRTVQTTPDYTINVQPSTWSSVKGMYR
jgi:Tol biopolymer transport system component